METDDTQLLVVSEAGSVEDRLRRALGEVDAAAASLAWMEQQTGPDWSGNLPASVELMDVSQRLRALLHRVVLAEGWEETS